MPAHLTLTACYRNQLPASYRAVQARAYHGCYSGSYLLVILSAIYLPGGDRVYELLAALSAHLWYGTANKPHHPIRSGSHIKGNPGTESQLSGEVRVRQLQYPDQ